MNFTGHDSCKVTVRVNIFTVCGVYKTNILENLPNKEGCSTNEI